MASHGTSPTLLKQQNVLSRFIGSCALPVFQSSFRKLLEKQQLLRFLKKIQYIMGTRTPSFPLAFINHKQVPAREGRDSSWILQKSKADLHVLPTTRTALHFLSSVCTGKGCLANCHASNIISEIQRSAAMLHMVAVERR